MRYDAPVTSPVPRPFRSAPARRRPCIDKPGSRHQPTDHGVSQEPTRTGEPEPPPVERAEALSHQPADLLALRWREATHGQALGHPDLEHDRLDLPGLLVEHLTSDRRRLP